jgi:hypothetical protein
MQAATETSVMVEVAARPGKVLTRKAAAESSASTAKIAPAKAAVHMGATEFAAPMSATTETANVSNPTSPTVRSKRASGQPPGESGSRLGLRLLRSARIARTRSITPHG